MTSLNTRTTPSTPPSSTRIGEAVSSMANSSPLRLMSSALFFRLIPWPLLRHSVTGSRTGSRVWSSMILKTSLSGLPIASATVHPVRVSAIGLIKSTIPVGLVEITASPMDCKVTLARFSEVIRAMAAFLRSLVS